MFETWIKGHFFFLCSTTCQWSRYGPEFAIFSRPRLLSRIQISNPTVCSARYTARSATRTLLHLLKEWRDDWEEVKFNTHILTCKNHEIYPPSIHHRAFFGLISHSDTFLYSHRFSWQTSKWETTSTAKRMNFIQTQRQYIIYKKGKILSRSK
jgi:hypothetical protein